MAFPFFLQPDSMDCGPTCLKMISKYYGRNIPLNILRERMKIDKDGVSILAISEAAESFGFRTQVVKLNIEALRTVNIPCILHWNQDHFVVLFKIKTKRGFFSLKNKRDRFFLMDPAQGEIQLGRSDFLEKWNFSNSNDEATGIALLIEPSPAFFSAENDQYQKSTNAVSFGKVFLYLKPFKKLIGQLVAGLFISSLLQLILPFLAQSVIDVGINTANVQFIYLVLFAQLALFLGRLITDFVRSWILLHISTRISVSILTDFLAKLMRLPIAFFESRKTGDILQRMNDHQRIESFLTGSSVNVLFSIISLVVFSIVLAVFNSQIFSVFIVSSVLYSIWVVAFLKRRKNLDYKRFEVLTSEQSATIQMIQGMQEIKLNGIEKAMRSKWETLQAKLFKLNMVGLSLNQWQQSGALFINEGKNIIITFISAMLVIEGKITLGTMLAIQYIIGQLNSPVEQMISFLQSWQNARISIDRLNEIQEMDDEEPVNSGLIRELPFSFSKQLVGGRTSVLNGYDEDLDNREMVRDQSNDLINLSNQHGIVFNDVSFTYTGGMVEPVLKDINLVIPKGKTTAIVGTSGSGKTTLLKLLLKFYDPQKGEIKLDGTSLRILSHREWRKHCGIVMQESYIFSDSILRNIAIGEDVVNVEKLYHAARVANVMGFIESLPLGFKTKIGAEGIGISVGQKQRILIARAVYKDPEFILFDEATNSLDANNERAIVENLSSFFKNKTVVVVAHRLSTVKHADQIVVLNRGAIKERGTHEELISLRGEYFTLIKNQLELNSK